MSRSCISTSTQYGLNVCERAIKKIQSMNEVLGGFVEAMWEYLLYGLVMGIVMSIGSTLDPEHNNIKQYNLLHKLSSLGG